MLQCCEKVFAPLHISSVLFSFFTYLLKVSDCKTNLNTGQSVFKLQFLGMHNLSALRLVSADINHVLRYWYRSDK